MHLLESDKISLGFDRKKLKEIQKHYPGLIKDVLSAINEISRTKKTVRGNIENALLMSLGNFIRNRSNLQKLARKIWTKYCQLLNGFNQSVGESRTFCYGNNSATITCLGRSATGVSNEKTFLLTLLTDSCSESFFIKLLNLQNIGDGFSEYKGTTILKRMGYPVFEPILGYKDNKYSLIVYPFDDDFISVYKAHQIGKIASKEYRGIKEQIRHIKKDANKKLDVMPDYKGHDIVDFGPHNCVYRPDLDPPFLIMDVIFKPETISKEIEDTIL